MFEHRNMSPNKISPRNAFTVGDVKSFANRLVFLDGEKDGINQIVDVAGVAGGVAAINECYFSVAQFAYQANRPGRKWPVNNRGTQNDGRNSAAVKAVYNSLGASLVVTVVIAGARQAGSFSFTTGRRSQTVDRRSAHVDETLNASLGRSFERVLGSAQNPASRRQTAMDDDLGVSHGLAHSCVIEQTAGNQLDR